MGREETPVLANCQTTVVHYSMLMLMDMVVDWCYKENKIKNYQKIDEIEVGLDLF